MEPLSWIVIAAAASGVSLYLATRAREATAPKRLRTRLGFDDLTESLELHSIGPSAAVGARGERRISLRRAVRKRGDASWVEVWVCLHLERPLDLRRPSAVVDETTMAQIGLGPFERIAATPLGSDPELTETVRAARASPFYVVVADRAIALVSKGLPRDAAHAWELFEALARLEPAVRGARERTPLPHDDGAVGRLEALAAPLQLRVRASPARAFGRFGGADVTLSHSPAIDDRAECLEISVALRRPLGAFATLERGPASSCTLDYAGVEARPLDEWSARAWGATLPPVLERPELARSLAALPSAVHAVRLAGGALVVAGSADRDPRDLLEAGVELARAVAELHRPRSAYR